MKGKLYMLPVNLSEADLQWAIPENVLKQTIGLKVFIVENIRTARRFLKKADRTIDIDQLLFFELNKHTPKDSLHEMLQKAEEGLDIGLMSEAGMPGIADPGADIALLAHQKGIQVVALTGPSSVSLALAASGLNGQSFAFNGYLPIEKADRIKRLRDLENRSLRENQTQLFIETPFRNNQIITDILEACSADTLLCIAADITAETEFVKTAPIREWKKNKPDINKRPAIFLLHKYR